MSIIITVLHVVACFFLIVVVLLQTGKGADIGAVFGGSSQTIFGSSGAGNLLTRLTTWTAALFMFTSLFLTWNSTRHLTTSVIDTLPAEPPPIVEPATPEGGAVAPEGGAAGDAAPGAGAGSDAAGADGSTAQAPAAAEAPAADAPSAAGAPSAETAPAPAQRATDDAAAGNAAGAAGKPAPPAEAAPAAP